VTPIPGARRKLSFDEAISRIGWWERIFLFILVIFLSAVLMSWSDVVISLSVIGLIITGPMALWRMGRLMMRSIIWRLRNRLIVAYLFVALVPLVLLGTLAVVATYVVTGQMAIHLVNSELGRQTGTLRGAADSILRVPAERRAASTERLGAFFEERFPSFEIRVDQEESFLYPEGATIERPPAGWKDVAGIVVKDGAYFIWAHIRSKDGEVTAMAPLTNEYLSGLVPGLGPVSLVGSIEEVPAKGLRLRGKKTSDPVREATVPNPINAVDLQLNWFSLIPLDDWSKPEQRFNAVLRVQTRIFSVFRVIFSNRADWDQNFGLNPLSILTVLFIIFELIALIIGVSLTRTITKTVHEIYTGTGRVMEGDFAYRIPISGSDQLAQLGDSFNRMTAHLEQLLQVAKENERLNAELEIAREVQRQLYPKGVPESTGLVLTAHYQPARMVSGDYFDFHRICETKLSFTMGDVAGKGISAALLMATVQSSFRSQIQNCPEDVGTAKLVTELNKQLYNNTAPEKFATFFFGIFDEPSGVLRYTNAGHLPPILLRNNEARLLEVDGMVVGAFPFAKYGESSVQLEPGDLLLLYTDGISEPQNEYGEMYGEERLIELLKKNARQPESVIIHAIMSAVQDWTGSPELQDDMTILIARRK
jgi:sigma-B regulation protein RsbU (phosphoserine phosphatase)